MAYSYKTYNQHDALLLWAVVLSLALHALTLMLLPGFSFSHVIKTTEPLTVELQQLPPPPKVEPPKPSEPEKVKPPRPEPPKLEKVVPKPTPPKPETPPVTAIPPTQIETPPPPSVVSPPKAPPPQPAVIAVEPKAAEPPPVFTVSKPEVVESNEDSLGDVRAAYGRLLRDELSRHTKYPAVAALKGWEGKVRIKLQVDKDGNVIGTPEVVEKSGHPMLDDDAVKTILNASPLPMPPSQLQGKPIFINTTIDYHKPR
jgi:protein TonB